MENWIRPHRNAVKKEIRTHPTFTGGVAVVRDPRILHVAPRGPDGFAGGTETELFGLRTDTVFMGLRPLAFDR